MLVVLLVQFLDYLRGYLISQLLNVPQVAVDVQVLQFLLDKFVFQDFTFDERLNARLLDQLWPGIPIVVEDLHRCVA